MEVKKRERSVLECITLVLLLLFVDVVIVLLVGFALATVETISGGLFVGAVIFMPLILALFSAWFVSRVILQEDGGV